MDPLEEIIITLCMIIVYSNNVVSNQLMIKRGAVGNNNNINTEQHVRDTTECM
jgi:hypothetical protein